MNYSLVAGRRLAIVTRSISFGEGVGGFERASAEQARQLAHLGWRISLIAPARFVHGTVPFDLIDVPWPKYGTAPGRPGFGLTYASWVRKARRTVNSLPPFDSIYLHGAAAGVLPIAQQGTRVVVNPHGMEEFARSDPLRWTNRVLLRKLSRRGRFADQAIATDVGLTSAVVKNIGIDAPRVSILLNGVDVRSLTTQAAEGQGVAVSADVVSVGRITHNKGYDLLLEALGSVAGLLIPSDQRLRWVHFGSGPQEAALAAAASKQVKLEFRNIRNASDAVVQASLAKARLFVQPSRYEGSSLTTLEAMTHGVVCVGTPVGGIPEKIVDGETGFLASDVTAAALADAIRRAWRGSDARVGENAARLVREKYDIPAIALRLSNILTNTER